MSYRSIEDPATLRRVLEATLLLAHDRDVSNVLLHFTEEACSMTGARYGALGVLNDDRTALSEFVTVGLGPEERAAIGALPTGRGVLGLMIADPRPRRLADLGSHPESFGFPPNHPPMTSFLGVPVTAGDEVFGNLYLTNKLGWSEFTSDDEAVVSALALAAGIAIENARLNRAVSQVAVYADRDRLARDLHDTVIQRLFAVGLSLQSIAGSESDNQIAKRIQKAISDLDETIVQVRSEIYEMGLTRSDGRVHAVILSLVRDLGHVTGFEVRVIFSGAVDTLVSDELAEHVLAVIRETVTNIGRHAQASEAQLSLSVSEGQCVVEITDNGCGLGRHPDGNVGGHGLVNMRQRAEKLNGTFDAESPEAGGTRVIWKVPVG